MAPNDPATRALAILDRLWGVDALWIYGSQARGTATPRSDLDLAALFRVRPGPGELLTTRGKLEIAAAMPVDVIDLESTSPILALQVLRHGVLVVDRQPKRRASFVASVPGRYEDLMIVRRNIERTILARTVHGRA